MIGSASGVNSSILSGSSGSIATPTGFGGNSLRSTTATVSAASIAAAASQQYPSLKDLF